MRVWLAYVYTYKAYCIYSGKEASDRIPPLPTQPNYHMAMWWLDRSALARTMRMESTRNHGDGSL